MKRFFPFALLIALFFCHQPSFGAERPIQSDGKALAATTNQATAYLKDLKASTSGESRKSGKVVVLARANDAADVKVVLDTRFDRKQGLDHSILIKVRGEVVRRVNIPGSNSHSKRWLKSCIQVFETRHSNIPKRKRVKILGKLKEYSPSMLKGVTKPIDQVRMILAVDPDSLKMVLDEK